MENNRRPLALSLQNWPTHPLPSKTLSPHASHQALSEILPLSYKQYIKLNLDDSISTTKEMYQADLNRRNKKVSILIELRSKYVLRDLPKSLSKSRAVCKEGRIAKQESKVENKQEGRQVRKAGVVVKNSRHHSNSSKIRSIKKQKVISFNQPNDSEYFASYNPHKQEETKIKIPQQHLKEEYGYGTICSNRKKRKTTHAKKTRTGSKSLSKLKNSNISNEKEHQLCHELVEEMRKWDRIDRVHLKEMSRMADLSQKERERLAKIQSLEKSQIRCRIKRIKSGLNSVDG